MINRRIAIIEAPSTLGLSTKGVECLPRKLKELGLADRIGNHWSINVPTVPATGLIDPSTGVLNAHEIAQWSPQLANEVGAVLDSGSFPIVLGGDCTIVLGSMLAFRRRGRYGLFFIDGNADFFQPEAEEKGEGASMDLAFVIGYGPKLVTQLEGFHPIVRPEDAVAFGFRDHEDQRRFGSQPLPDELAAFDIDRIRQLGAERAARMAVDHLTRPGLEGFFIHLDADVLDDAVMPAVDFRIPGGLSPEEVVTVLTVALESPKVRGIEVAIYNPELDDEGGRAGRVLTDVLSRALNAIVRTS